MILVLLGTQNNNFHRLLEEIERLIQSQVIKEEVVVQAGYTKYTSENMKILDFIPKEELENLQNQATKNKKVIAVPRLHQYEEHVNNHQTQIVEVFNQKGYIVGIQGIEELEKAIRQVEQFKPKKYTQNHDKMLKIIEHFIENC